MSANSGPCKVNGCDKNDPTKYKFKRFTEYAKTKAIRADTYQNYNYLQIGDQLCLSHYLSIVEADRNKKNKNKKRKLEEFDEIYIEDDDHTEFGLSYFLENSNDNKLNFNHWSNVNVKYYDDEVSLSKNNFDLLIKKISVMEKKIREYEEINIRNLNQLKENFKLLSKTLCKRQRQLQLEIELDPKKFQNMIEENEPQLKGFFDELVDIFLPSSISDGNIENRKKSLVGFCYLLSGLGNQYNNSLQLEVGLYLSSSGITSEAIDIMSRLGISVSYKTVERYKKKIADNHLKKMDVYFEENKHRLFCFNIDDYHSIHSYRNPNTTSLSSAHHMATCVAKTVENSSPIPAMENNVSIHNPENIEDQRINKYLVHTYIDSLSKSYNAQKYSWQSNNLITMNEFDRIELLTVHSYDDSIEQHCSERSMMNCHLVNMKELNLKNLDNYLNAIKMITDILSLNTYLKKYIIPIVADFPGQLFIRKAITLLQKQKEGQNISPQIPDVVNNFVPILGPLHVSLNMREHIILVHWNFFEKMFKSIFGQNKVLAQKPKPWKINLLLELARSAWLEIAEEIFKKFGPVCKDIEYQTLIDILDNLIPAALDVYSIIFRSGSCDQYVDTIFRLWTCFEMGEKKL